jgi:outer membrane protein TolC
MLQRYSSRCLTRFDEHFRTAYRKRYFGLFLALLFFAFGGCLRNRSNLPSDAERFMAGIEAFPPTSFQVSTDIGGAVDTGPRDLTLEAEWDDSETVGLLEVVYQTLALSPDLQIQEQSIQFAQGIRQEQRGRFDVNSNTGLHGQQNYDDLTRTRDSGLVSGLTRRLRNGRQVGVSMNSSRLSDVVENSGIPNTGTVRFFVQQPLLRRRGIGTQGAEIASQASLNAERYEMARVIADRVTDTTKAYWDYVAAHQRLQIAIARQERTRGRLDDVQVLIEKSEQPRSAIILAEADLADVSAERLNKQAELYNARQSLGVAIGLPFGEIQNMPLPSDDLLALADSLQPDQIPDLFAMDLNSVFDRRGEVLAARERMEAAYVVLQSNKQNAKPELSVNMNVGYSNVENGSQFSNYIQPFFDSPPGANAGVSVSYDSPFGNNQRLGVVSQSRATYLQQKIAIDNLRRVISSDLSVAINTLQRGVESSVKRNLAAERYADVLRDETKRYRLGMATLLDVLQVEESYTSAQLASIDAANFVAKALIELRRVSGDIVPLYGQQIDLQRDTLVGLPPLWDRQE